MKAIRSQAEDTLVKLALTSQSLAVRRMAVHLLIAVLRRAQGGDVARVMAVSRLVDMASPQQQQQQDTTLRALEATAWLAREDPKCAQRHVQVLTTLTSKLRHPDERALAGGALSACQPPAETALKLVEAHARAKSPSDRATAMRVVESLARAASPCLFEKEGRAWMDATDTARALLNDTDGAVRASAATALARLAIMATSGAALAALTASSEAAAKQGKRVVGPSPTVQKLIAAAEDKCIIAPFRRACVEAVGHAANAAATAVEMYLAAQDDAQGIVDAAIRVVSSIDSIAFGDRPMQRASSMDAVSGSSGGNITRWLGRAVRSGTTSGGSSSPRAGGTGALALDTTIDAGVAAAATTRVVRAVNAGVLVRGDDATRRALLGALTKRLLATAEATTCTTSAADAAALLLCIDAIDLLTELTQAHASALDTALEKLAVAANPTCGFVAAAIGRATARLAVADPRRAAGMLNSAIDGMECSSSPPVALACQATALLGALPQLTLGMPARILNRSVTFAASHIAKGGEHAVPGFAILAAHWRHGGASAVSLPQSFASETSLLKEEAPVHSEGARCAADALGTALGSSACAAIAQATPASLADMLRSCRAAVAAAYALAEHASTASRIARAEKVELLRVAASAANAAAQCLTARPDVLKVALSYDPQVAPWVPPARSLVVDTARLFVKLDDVKAFGACHAVLLHISMAPFMDLERTADGGILDIAGSSKALLALLSEIDSGVPSDWDEEVDDMRPLCDNNSDGAILALADGGTKAARFAELPPQLRLLQVQLQLFSALFVRAGNEGDAGKQIRIMSNALAKLGAAAPQANSPKASAEMDKLTRFGSCALGCALISASLCACLRPIRPRKLAASLVAPVTALARALDQVARPAYVAAHDAASAAGGGGSSILPFGGMGVGAASDDESRVSAARAAALCRSRAHAAMRLSAEAHALSAKASGAGAEAAAAVRAAVGILRKGVSTAASEAVAGAAVMHASYTLSSLYRHVGGMALTSVLKTSAGAMLDSAAKIGEANLPAGVPPHATDALLACMQALADLATASGPAFTPHSNDALQLCINLLDARDCFCRRLIPAALREERSDLGRADKDRDTPGGSRYAAAAALRTACAAVANALIAAAGPELAPRGHVHVTCELIVREAASYADPRLPCPPVVANEVGADNVRAVFHEQLVVFAPQVFSDPDAVAPLSAMMFSGSRDQRAFAMASFKQLVERRPMVLFEAGVHVNALAVLDDEPAGSRCAADAAHVLSRLLESCLTVHLQESAKKVGSVSDVFAHWVALLRSVALADGRAASVAAVLQPFQSRMTSRGESRADFDDSDGDIDDDFGDASNAGENAHAADAAIPTSATRLNSPGLRAREHAASTLACIPQLCVRLVDDGSNGSNGSNGSTDVVDTAIRESATTVPPSPLVEKLGELSQAGYRLATGNSPNLRAPGLDLLLALVATCGNLPDPEMPGHRAMELYQVQFVGAIKAAFSTAAASSVNEGETSPASAVDPLLLERGCALLNAFMDARMMGDDDAVFTRLLSLVDAALLQHVGKASSEDFIGSFADWCGELTRVRLLECHAQVTELFYEDEAKAGGGDFSRGGDTSSGLSVSEESRAAWDKHVAACSSSLRQGWSDVIWRSMRLDDLDDNSTHPRVRDALQRCHGHAVRALAYGEAKDAHAPCSPVLFADLSRRLDAAMSSSHTTGVGAIVEVSSWLDHAARVARLAARHNNEQSAESLAACLADTAWDVVRMYEQSSLSSDTSLQAATVLCASRLAVALTPLTSCHANGRRAQAALAAASAVSNLAPMSTPAREARDAASANIAFPFALRAASKSGTDWDASAHAAVHAILSEDEAMHGDALAWLSTAIDAGGARAESALNACATELTEMRQQGRSCESDALMALMLCAIPRAIQRARAVLGQHHAALVGGAPSVESLTVVRTALATLAEMHALAAANANAVATQALLAEGVQLAVQTNAVASAVGGAPGADVARAAVSVLGALGAVDATAFRACVASLSPAMKAQLQKALVPSGGQGSTAPASSTTTTRRAAAPSLTLKPITLARPPS